MIHRIRIQNFKSIRDVEVDLSPVTVLVGKSGSGKSSFVEAVRFLRDLLSDYDYDQYPWSDLFCENQPTIHRGAPFEIEVEFSVPGMTDSFSYQMSICGLDPRIVYVSNERLDVGSRCVFHHSSVELHGKIKADWVKEPEVHDIPHAGGLVLGRLPALPESVIAYVALSSSIGCYMFSDSVLSIPQRGKQQQQQSAKGLDDDGGNYLQILRRIVTDLNALSVRKSIVSALNQINESVTSAELDDLQNPGNIVVGHALANKRMALRLNQESAGFRRFFAHLLAIYQVPPMQTCLFEHPEDGIHPGALALLADEFSAAPDNGRGQMILTTHSPELLDRFKPEQIRVVQQRGFETQIGPLDEQQQVAVRDHLIGLGELLTVDPARMQPIPAGDATE